MRQVSKHTRGEVSAGGAAGLALLIGVTVGLLTLARPGDLEAQVDQTRWDVSGLWETNRCWYDGRRGAPPHAFTKHTESGLLTLQQSGNSVTGEFVTQDSVVFHLTGHLNFLRVSQLFGLPS